ncbi:hypothetical protein LZQ00_10785 [Sphingobacterium sp. SRCM116780]|uniref:hypothetical protein n=1 Tax=Sphingobacterium sp. SRCM116780 TaxID=2907623 RepID=UPI001F1ACF21|nr:hypothetical protein [Sphingobacterium sp. SRCM116780]UIR54761.1 hypothetical protein LZQ00_10785 [Sphingobacterium sp. SRCM116780]
MREIIVKISRVLQVVLMAPIKLPVKVLEIVKYIALGLGVIETVLDKGQEEETEKNPPAEKEDQLEESASKVLLDEEEYQKVPNVVMNDTKNEDDPLESLQDDEGQPFERLHRTEPQQDDGTERTVTIPQDVLDQDVGLVKEKIKKSEKKKEGANENQ